MSDDHPPIYPDEHGDWAAANMGARRLTQLARCPSCNEINDPAWKKCWHCGRMPVAEITVNVCGGKQARICRVTGKEHNIVAMVHSKDGGSLACTNCGALAIDIDMLELP